MMVDWRKFIRYYLFAFLAGMVMPYLTGFLGLMPLDQSIIFEAAGRIAKGQLPFRDFYLAYGLSPAVMQAVFFTFLGINWAAYVTHAAFVNGCFAVILFDCLLLLVPGVNAKKALAGSLLAAWAFYAMTGTPFLENHSLFFAVCAYWTVIAGLLRKKHYLLFFCFPLLVAAFYSKPIPAIFWMLPICLECWLNRRHFRHYIVPLLMSFVFGCLLLILPALIFPADAFYYYTILLPLKLGRGRVEEHFIGRVVHAAKYFKLLLLLLIPFLVYFFSRNESGRLNSPQVIRGFIFVFISLLFGVLTKNAFYNVTTPVFVFASVIFHFLLIREKYENRLLSLYRRFNFIIWLMIFAGVSALNFRRTIDIHFQFTDLSAYSREIGVCVKTPLRRYEKEDVEKLQRLIINNRALYTGDMQFLYSLSGRYNPLPLTHINDHTTYNSADSSQYLKLKRQLVENVLRCHSNLLIEDESIYNPDQDLVRFLRRLKGQRVDSFAGIKVFKIDTSALYDVANNLNINREK